MPSFGPVRLPVVVLVLALGVTLGLASLALLSDDLASENRAVSGRAPGPATERSTETPTRARALAVLHDWDRRRAAAWATGNEVALARLYASSTARRADVALLRRYLRRGVTVVDARMQLLRAAVLIDRPRRVVVRVTERLAGRIAKVGAQAVLLPRDQAETCVVDLRRVKGAWRVAAVMSRWLSR